MTQLREQVRSELVAAQKAQSALKVSVLRNLLAEAKNKEIDLQHELTDEELLTVIRKQVKVLEEAKKMVATGGRNDLASANQAEIELLSVYLPAEMSDEELKEKVRAVISAHSEITNVGQLTGMVIRELKDVAESNRIAGMVRALKTE